MKTILITFTGNYVSENSKENLNKVLLNAITTYTDAEGELDIVHLSDEDVKKVLIREGIVEAKSKSKRNTDFENELTKYCELVVWKTGIDPRDEDDGNNKILFIKAFFIFPELRQPKQVLHWLKNCVNPTPKCQGILELHGLTNLPDWVKEITSITNVL